MIFVDTNVWMYAIGKEHPLRATARGMVGEWGSRPGLAVTSAEVLQELLHAYTPVDRQEDLRAALTLAVSIATPMPLEPADVRLASDLSSRERGLGARDLVHLAWCIRREVDEIATFDRGLAAAFARL